MEKRGDLSLPGNAPYSVERSPGYSSAEGNAVSEFRILQTIDRIGITEIYETAGTGSKFYSSDFVMAMKRTKEWIAGKAADYAIKNRTLAGIDSLIKDDPLTELSQRFKWKGLHNPADKCSEDSAAYLEFASEWRAEKSEMFVALVQEYWAKMKPKSRLHWYAGAAAAGFAAVAFLGWAAYEHYIKPDIKNEIAQSMPAIPTLDEMIEKFRPEIQRELMSYNSQSSENIEKAIDSVLARYSKKNPLIGMLLPELKEKAAEDIREKDKKG